MDFLGDIQCESAYFSNLYFSKVKRSHNFRLPMPFREHIKIEVENTSSFDLWGYTEVQWEQVGAIPWSSPAARPRPFSTSPAS